MACNRAYVTLLTKTAYLPGTLVLHQCLTQVGSRYPLVVMVTPTVRPEDREILTRRGIKMRDIESLRPERGRIAEHDVRLEDAWTKLRYAHFDVVAWKQKH